MVFLPEGSLWNIPSNLHYMSSVSALRDAMHAQTVLEARAIKCDGEHDLHGAANFLFHGVSPFEAGLTFPFLRV